MAAPEKPPEIPSFCRDCFSQDISKSRCKSCGSTRIISHPELFTLSLAHIDCDAFYAAIEKRENPDLLSKPVIIGGGVRGVVATCCYIARTYGIHSAMPMFRAKKLCPEAVIIKPRGALYSQEGRRLRDMMRDLTPLVEPLSIDEAFLDLSGTEKVHRRPPALTLARFAKRVENEVGITVSIGLSYNKFLAKVASDFEKPRGFSIIGELEALGFLKDKPVNMIYGVGPALGGKLKRDGILTFGHLQIRDKAELTKKYGSIGTRLYNFSRGLDPRKVVPASPVKSVSAETTFNSDISDYAALEKTLWPLCEKVSARLKAKDLKGRVVTLKVKTAHFRSLTRNKTLPEATCYAETIFLAGQSLLAPVAKGERYRLIGVGVSDFNLNADAEPDFFAEKGSKKIRAEEAVDQVRKSFGKAAIKKGRSLK
ncbi:MAG: DNA polymerase IV [Sphingomonadales bacterium]